MAWTEVLELLTYSIRDNDIQYTQAVNSFKYYCLAFVPKPYVLEPLLKNPDSQRLPQCRTPWMSVVLTW